MRQGSTGGAVRAAQAELNALGARLTVNGPFNAATKTAVTRFQTGEDLPATGVVNTATWQALVS